MTETCNMFCIHVCCCVKLAEWSLRGFVAKCLDVETPASMVWHFCSTLNSVPHALQAACRKTRACRPGVAASVLAGDYTE